jgi:type II secretory ATPase GspE/PulE/Tfp pilus assembly ATPase PilB-like protein
MILVCGPTGAGKTTTIYALLKELESTQRNIMTLEDPIEYRFDSIIQGQVYSKIGFDFASGLRSILRQDPDVILVGEMRDRETAEIALKASLTGHLVFSTLHTNGAVDTFVRLLDMGLERFVVASALRAIVSQRLVRKLCRGCAQKVPMNQVARQFFDIAEDEERFLYRAKGCEKCNNTGFSGRTAIMEVLEIDDELSDVLKSSDLNRRELKALVQQRGLKSLRHIGMELVLKGITSIDEIARVT